MLLELGVENLLIVASARIHPGPGLCVVSGETGAGKSLLLDALGLVCGERARPQLVGPAGDEARVWAVFQLDPARWLAIAEAQGLAAVGADGTVIIRRHCHRGGRSRAWINDVPVSVGLLRTIGQALVAVSGQQAHLHLADVDRQLALVDRFAGHQDLAADYQALHARHGTLERELTGLRDGAEHSLREREFVEYQLAEIQALALGDGETEALERERELLAAAGSWRDAAFGAVDQLVDGDQALAPHLGRLAGCLAGAPDDDLAEAAALLDQAAAAVREAALAAARAGDRIQDDPARLAAIDERLDAIHDCLRKYGGDEQRLRDEWAHLQARAEELAGLEDHLAETEAALAAVAAEREARGWALAASRRCAAERLCRRVEAELADLAMPRARLGLREGAVKPTSHGLVEQALEIATNPGQEPGPLACVPSGGEAARINLALAAVCGDSDERPVLVFDEVDAGVGGRLGAAIALRLRRLASNRTVLAVTHTPQVAAAGQTHVVVRKVQDETRTEVRVESVTGSARLAEIADMLGGGEAALHQAQALVGSVRT